MNRLYKVVKRTLIVYSIVYFSFIGVICFQETNLGKRLNLNMTVYGAEVVEEFHRPEVKPLNMMLFESKSFRTQYSTKNPIQESSPLNVVRSSVYVKDFLNDINSGIYTDYELVNSFNDFICSHLQYDIDFSNVGMSDALFKGKGVCWHYTWLMHSLCDAAGIQNRIVDERIEGKWHVWNAVTINDREYFFDITWNDNCDSTMFSWLSEEEMLTFHEDLIGTMKT